MGAMSPTHWLIVIGVLVVLFGAERLPDIARSVGQSTRVLKSEVRALSAETEAIPGPSLTAAGQPAEQSATGRVQ
ncbi:Sec-independent protein translocase subunit TatA [Pseudonocardia sp. GCM10023141]|uniref:Sec-independent protein translocase subunit TatA n=1 Tax=Pseudonocardia sp. GCM10023141 TaxID=3252653 RepID=UPI00361C0389